MAFNKTTTSSAVATTDQSVVVASATGAAVGSWIRIDDEMMQIRKDYVSGTTIPVTRGLDGSVVAAHPATANVVIGLASDFANPGTGGPSVTYPSQKARQIVSYSANGAIALPVNGMDTVAILNGTGALTMTLANPTKDMDGVLLYIVANGKAAHGLTITSGLGNGSTASDVATFSASYAGGCTLMAVNEFWNLVGSGLYSANTPTGAPTWA